MYYQTDTKTSREKGVAEYTTRASQPSHLGTFSVFLFIYDDAATDTLMLYVILKKMEAGSNTILPRV